MEEPLARGRTADILAWEDGFVLKLYHDWFSLENIQYEQRLARAVHASGVRTPAAGELVCFHGRNGLVYERLEGVDMFTALRLHPQRLFYYAARLAQLHLQMHARTFDGEAIPRLRPRLHDGIDQAASLPDSLKRSLLQRLELMPDGERVCHGDFHPGNVIVAGEEAQVIDWIDAARGSPPADVARSSILLLGAAAAQEPNPISKIFLRLFHAAYLRHYFRLQPGGRQEYRLWLPLVAAARLSEGIGELETWLIQQASRVDSET